MNEKVIDVYNYGDVAEIRNYSIFIPAPSSWNTSYYGIGKEYHEYDKYTVVQSLDLYGQYGKRRVSYHFLSSDYVEYFDVMFNQTIEVPIYETPQGVKNENFKCWNVGDKQCYPGEFLVVDTDVHLLPSASIQYKLEFDGNGATSGSQSDISATNNTYVQNVDGIYQQKEEKATVVLPKCNFQKTNTTFYSWEINGTTYNEGQQYDLTSNSVAKAIWNTILEYNANVIAYGYDGERLDTTKVIYSDKTVYTTKYGDITLTGSKYDQSKIINVNVASSSELNYISFNSTTTKSNPYTIVCEYGKVNTIYVGFSKLQTYDIDVKCNPDNGGKVQIESISKNTFKLTAVPNENYEFANWSGYATSTQNPLTIEIKDYIKLEYIESSGTQWIDFGLYATQNTMTQLKIMPLTVTGGSFYTAPGPTGDDNADYRLFNYNSQIYWDLNVSRLIGSEKSFVVDQAYEFEVGNNYVKNVGASSNILNGSKITQHKSVQTLRTSGASQRIYYIKIYESGNIVRDMVPAKTPSDEVCMFDKVTNQFFYNQATKSFIAGPTIESDAIASIQANFNISDDSTIIA